MESEAEENHPSADNNGGRNKDNDEDASDRLRSSYGVDIKHPDVELTERPFW